MTSEQSLKQLDDFDSLLDSVTQWIVEAEQNQLKLSSVVPSSPEDAEQLLADCRRFYDDVAAKQNDVEELSNKAHRLRHGTRCLAQSNQTNSRYSLIVGKAKV